MSLIKNIASMIVVHPLNQMMLVQFVLKASANKNEKMYTCVINWNWKYCFVITSKTAQISPVSCDFNWQNRFLYYLDAKQFWGSAKLPRV